MTKTAATFSKRIEKYFFGFLITFLYIPEGILLIFKNAFSLKKPLKDAIFNNALLKKPYLKIPYLKNASFFKNV